MDYVLVSFFAFALFFFVFVLFFGLKDLSSVCDHQTARYEQNGINHNLSISCSYGLVSS